MTPELWQRLKPLYNIAIEMEQSRRAQYIAEACGSDAELREELEALLEAADISTVAGGSSPFVNFGDVFPSPNNSFSEGELVLGRFKIIRHLGTGGMGEVYEANDLELGRIALKTIRSGILANGQALLRFKKEVQLARKVSGPHVCRIHEFFPMDTIAGSHPAFLTMEFLDGVTLADKITESGPFFWRDAQRIMVEICAGLQTIHDAGIIHRDLKSRNIMLASRHGSLCTVLMDFGLAHEISRSKSESETDISTPGAIVGTLNYMAPEQFEGKELSPAADIFALGVVLYELVTAQRPFVSDTPIEAAILRGKRPCLASMLQKSLPHRFDDVICKCLEFEPKRRYQSAREVADELESRWFSPVRLRRHWYHALAFVGSVILLYSSLLLIPAVRERLEGIFFSSRDKHIAVLPFDIAGNDPRVHALGEGLMDSLAGRLSNLGATNERLWVVPSSEVRARKVMDASSARREFGATLAIKGNFRQDDPAVHLGLTLIDTKNMREVGFTEAESDDGDLAAVEDEAVTRLERLMNLSTAKEDSTGDYGSIRPAAYQDYLAGLGYMQHYDRPGNLDAAISSLRRAVDTDPHFALGFAELGEAYRLKYQLDQDLKWLDPAQKFCGIALAMDNNIASAYVTLGIIHRITGKQELALQEFQRALVIDPKNVNVINALAHVYENKGEVSLAESTFLKAAALRPDSWDGYNELGNFYIRQRKYQQAIAQYNQALRLNPDSAQLYSNLAMAYLGSGDQALLPAAIAALEKSIALSPSYSALANLGVLYGSEKRYTEYADVTEQALRLDDHDWRVWDNLVSAYEWLNEPAKTNAARRNLRERLEQIVKIKPEDADAQSTLAIVYAHDRLDESALSRIRAGMALAPDDPYVLSNVADAYELLGDRQRAIGFLQTAFRKGLKTTDVEQDPYLRNLVRDPRFRFPPQ